MALIEGVAGRYSGNLKSPEATATLAHKKGICKTWKVLRQASWGRQVEYLSAHQVQWHNKERRMGITNSIYPLKRGNL